MYQCYCVVSIVLTCPIVTVDADNHLTQKKSKSNILGFWVCHRRVNVNVTKAFSGLLHVERKIRAGDAQPPETLVTYHSLVA